LSNGQILKFPWKITIPINYQVVMDITRFDGMPGGNVDLRARWDILGENGKKVLSKGKSVLTEPIGGDTIAEMVSAQSRLVAKLSHEIAEKIKRLEEKKPRQ
ncbi:MAG: PqiC family protein, partial [Desulfobacterales bacterium]